MTVIFTGGTTRVTMKGNISFLSFPTNMATRVFTWFLFLFLFHDVARQIQWSSTRGTHIAEGGGAREDILENRRKLLTGYENLKKKKS
jgi:hypothetical protein